MCVCLLFYKNQLNIDSTLSISSSSCFIYIAAYGSMLKFKNARRLHPVGKSTLLACSGDMSDFQYMQEHLETLM